MMVFVVYAFTFAIYSRRRAPRARSTTPPSRSSTRTGRRSPRSSSTPSIRRASSPRDPGGEAQAEMDRGRFMFVVAIPPRFERDLRAGRNPEIQVNIDATAMQQAGIGAGYIKDIINDRDPSFSGAPRTAAGTGHSGHPQAVQPERRLVVVQERGRHHQPDHAADGRPDRGRGDPRARARHPGAPARDAADRVRDRDGEGVGEQPRDPRGDRGFAPLRRTRWR